MKKKTQSMYTLEPKCESGDNETFIEVNGFVSPCCWLVTDSNKIEMLKIFYGDEFEKLFLTKSSMKEISKLYEKIKKTWKTDNPFSTCFMSCRKKYD